MTAQMRFRGPSDLHIHSRVSDGTLAPADVVREAAAAGLGTIALTDHDSTAGWAEAADAAREAGVTLLPGMELSTRADDRSVHLLAYLFDPDAPGLVAETARIRQARISRAEQIVHRLSADYDLSWQDVLAQVTDGATVGRPHIADALVERGYVPDRSAAFASLLHRQGGYYEAHYAPDTLTAVRLVRAAGGVPVLAHPGTRARGLVYLTEAIAELVDAGLFGLEIDHRENTDDGKARLHELAEEFSLAVTGSSDFHGAGKPNSLGENTTSDAVVAAIITEAAGTRPVYPS